MSGNGDGPGLMPGGGIGSSGNSLTLQIAVVFHGRGSEQTVDQCLALGTAWPGVTPTVQCWGPPGKGSNEVRNVSLPLQLGFKGITGEFRSVNLWPGQPQASRQQAEAALIWDGVTGSSVSSDLLLLGFLRHSSRYEAPTV